MGSEFPKTSTSFPEDDNPMAQLLDQYTPACNFKRGQIVNGTIIRVDPDAVVVDVGSKCEGVVSGAELTRVDPSYLATLAPGDEVSAYVLDPEGPAGEVILSLARALQAEDWVSAEKLLNECSIIELEVIGSNRGGLLVQVGNTRGFVPASQLAATRKVPRISDPGCGEALSGMVGCQLQLRVIEANREQNRLILSEKAVLSVHREEEEVEFLSTLKEGEVRTGTVNNLTDFGAFVNLGALDGLLHLSEISWQPVKHPADVLEVGQQIEVMILSIDKERRQVALSIKRMTTDPWGTVAERYEAGQLVQGVITRLMKWGAFARIVGDEAIEGLIHVSELDEGRVAHPRDVVEQGQLVTLRVLNLDPERRRLALSLKQVVEGEHVDSDWRADYEAAGQQPLESPMASAIDEALRG
jgi:small subunit ribosomal protein S1